MRADLALFFTTIAAIAIVGLIVRNHQGSAQVISAAGNAEASVLGVAITGNPQFFSEAKGYNG